MGKAHWIYFMYKLNDKINRNVTEIKNEIYIKMFCNKSNIFFF